MSKLSKDDFDEFLGKDSFYSSEDKSRFFKRLDQKNKKKRRWVPQLATGIVVLLLFIVGVTTVQEGNFSFFDFNSTENNPDISVQGRQYATSYDEVDTYYERMTPGLKRAEELGLVTEVDKTVPINDDQTLHIDKIWYNSEGFYIFYDISLIDKLSRDEYGPTLTSFHFQGDQFSPQPSLYTKNVGPGEGVVYEDRFYHRMVANSLTNQSNEPYLQLNETYDVDLTVTLGEERVTIEGVEIPIYYDANKESTYTNEVNKTIEDEHATLTFKELNIGVIKNQLLGTANLPKGHKLSEIKGRVTTDKGETHQIMGFSEEMDSNRFVLDVPAFNDLPNEVTIDIESISVIGEDSFTFTIDAADYNEQLSSTSSYEKKINEKIDEIRDTSIYLDRLYYDERGIDFTILYEPNTIQQPIELQQTIPSTPDEKEHSQFSTVVTAINEKGEPGQYGQRGSGSGNRFDMFLNKSFVEASEQIDITIERLLYKVTINESFKIPISIKE